MREVFTFQKIVRKRKFKKRNYDGLSPKPKQLGVLEYQIKNKLDELQIGNLIGNSDKTP